MLSEILVKSSAIASAVIPPPTGSQPNTSIDRDHVSSGQAQSRSGVYRVTNSSSYINERASDATQSLMSDVMNDQSIKAQLLRPYIKTLIEDALVQQQQESASYVIREHQTRRSNEHSALMSRTQKGPVLLDGNEANSLKLIKYHGRRKGLVISRGERIRTALHRPWIGSVTVKSHSSVSKEWNDELQRYEIEKEGWETTIHLRLAPWLTDKAFDIRFQNFIATYSGPRTGFTLEPVRYTHIPLATSQAITQGDLTSLKAMIARRELFLKDRSSDTEQNLLEMSFQALTRDWYEAQNSGNPRYTSSIIDTCQWLLSQGLSFDNPDRWLLEVLDANHPEVPDSFNENEFFLKVGDDLPDDETAEVAYNVTNILMNSITNGSSIARARMLIMCAIVGGKHRLDVETAIWDLVLEGGNDKELELLKTAEKTFWSRRANDLIFMGGLEAIVQRSMLNFSSIKISDRATAFKGDARCKILGGPRRLLIALMGWLLMQGFDSSSPTGPLETLLRFCKPMGILEDGFAACVSRWACKHHMLPVWN